MKATITRESRWLGNGFGSETTHTARLGDRVVGEFRSGSVANWAFDARGIVCMTYAGWRRELAAGEARERGRDTGL